MYQISGLYRISFGQGAETKSKTQNRQTHFYTREIEIYSTIYSSPVDFKLGKSKNTGLYIIPRVFKKNWAFLFSGKLLFFVVMREGGGGWMIFFAGTFHLQARQH